MSRTGAEESPRSKEAEPGRQDIITNVLASATAAAVAEATTIPLDTAKVRLQLQSIRQLRQEAGASAASAPKYRGPFQTLATIVREEGVAAPFKGLSPGLHRQFIFTGLRLGLYDHIKRWVAGDVGDASLGHKVVAAVITSSVGITAANPSDVLKVRFQADASASGRTEAGSLARQGVLRAYATVARAEGVWGGLYKGYAANLMRNSTISTAEIVSYDWTKRAALDSGVPDGLGLHLGCGLAAGFVATLLGSPADVLGTRLITTTGHARLWATVVAMARDEGLTAFYKGFWPNFARIGSFNVVLWATYEWLRGLGG